MRIRTLSAAALTAAILPLGLSTASPVSAATGGHARYVVLAGDDDYIVYAEKISAHALNPVSLNSQSDIYALGRSGGPVHLGKALLSAAVSISGANVVIVNPFKHHNRVRSWNLATGHHDAIGTNENVVAATPNGWISLDGGYEDGTHVVARKYSGGILDYGTPITPGVDYGVTVGPDGFVAYANNSVNDNGEVSYTPWAHPKTHRTLLEPGNKNVHCDSVSDSYAGCVLRGGINRSIALITLDGAHTTTAGNRCAYQVAVWDSRLAWTSGVAHQGCEIGPIGVTSRAGASKHTDEHFNILGMTVAWDRVVTSSEGQRGLVTLGSVSHKAKPLSRADVG